MSGRRKVVFVPSDRSACAWYRCLTPTAALNAAGYEAATVERLVQQDVETCDVLVAQRVASPAMLHAFSVAKAHGALTVFDIDDDLWNVNPKSPAHAYFSKEEIQSGLTALARSADLVTTTTPALAERLRQFNSRVRIIPNCLPDPFWAVKPSRPDRGEAVVLGWAGSSTHVEDFAILNGILEPALERYPLLEVHLAGAGRDWAPAHPRVKHLKTVPLEQYPRLLAGFDIGMAPLTNGRFNQCKSDLKVLEYSMMGIPVVASKVDAYESYLTHRVDGMLASSPKDWIRAIGNLVEDAQLRDRMGCAARKLAERRLASRNVGRYVEAYGLER